MKIFWQHLTTVGLSIGCLVCGFGFYHMNHGDWINASVFTIGLLGVMLSVRRQQSKRG